MTNISWGTRIAILYGAFVLLIVSMVILCINQKVDLVSDDYYDKEVTFQKKINEMNNANLLVEKVTHKFTKEGIEITFPKELITKGITGTILFFRPSDKSKDITVPVAVNENAQQTVALNNFSKGMYKMQIDWKADEVPYFAEEVIVVP